MKGKIKTKMKHIKKYKGELSKKEQGSLRSKARQRAKHILYKKHFEEYLKIYEPIYRKLRREYFNIMKGGIKQNGK